MGRNIALCLDDGWLTEGSYNECMNLAIKTRADINNAGLVVNEQNSLWQPCQELYLLGLIWNSVDGTISITQSRLTRIFQTIQYLKSQKFYVSERELASFIGQIISTSAVTRNVCQIMTRHCSMSVAAAPSWDSKFNLDDYCLREIEFWESNLKQLNSRVLYQDGARSHYVVYSDTSDLGCGAHMSLDGEQVCHKHWTKEESQYSSTWRELSAIEYALESFVPLLEHAYVKWFSDSQTACSITRVGSMRKDLHSIAIRIYKLCLDHKIDLDIECIPRTEIHRAEYISRLIDIDDWQITQKCFYLVEEAWAPSHDRLFR